MTTQVKDFLKETGTSFKAEYLDHDFYFDGDKECRDIYRITLKRNGKQFSFRFGQSIANAGQEPTAYDVLACLTKYDVGSFENFCSEFGYSNDSIKASKLYKAVLREYNGVNRLFSDVMERLQEIQ